MESGKTGKYFKYAIGEIVLVVIGILIALSINNWNENRKNQIQIVNILQALHNDLIKDSTRVVYHIDFSKKVVSQHNDVINRSRHEMANMDTLIYLGKNEFRPAWISPLNYTTTTFQSIKSSGNFEMLSDTLKAAITSLYNWHDYYDNTLKSINTGYQDIYNNFTQSYIPNDEAVSSYLARELSWVDIDEKDFAIKFDGILKHRKVLWEFYLNSLEQQQTRTEELKDLIRSELSNHN